MNWIADLSTARFALLVVSVFMVLTATTWMACSPTLQDTDQVFTPRTSSEPVEVTEGDLRGAP